MSKLRTVGIEEIHRESPTISSFYLDTKIRARPGQFVMVWVPGVDEFPVALSRISDRCSITVKAVGFGTESLHRMKPGDMIGIRGPYGNGYVIPSRETLAIIGGYGGASILPVIDELNRRQIKVKCALGASCGDELLFLDELSEMSEMHMCTDDGSRGKHCMVTELAEDLWDNVENVLTCGPEAMMKKVVEMCSLKGIPVQASLERYMKCGMGLCDSCTMDGHRVCVDGPVFTGDELSNMADFGRFERDRTGRRIPL